MPVDMKLYPANWKEIRARIQARAGDKCERCGVKNGAISLLRRPEPVGGNERRKTQRGEGSGMSRETKTIIKCDVCNREVKQAVGFEFAVSEVHDNGELYGHNRRVDACSDCLRSMVAVHLNIRDRGEETK